MKIGIDISQLAYQGTGVAEYLQNLLVNLLRVGKDNEYILFYSSLRKKLDKSLLDLSKLDNVKIKTFKLPPSLLNVLWNRLHILPIETFIGKIDLFITSDWTEPPSRKAKKATILYDLIVYKYPTESHQLTRLNFKRLNILPNIVETQKRKLKWVKKESDIVFCISEATKQDAINILGLNKKKLKVIYPGI